MTARAVLFDLDGTLLDSLADIGESMNLALQSLGFAQHTLDRYRRFVGDGVVMLARRALPAGCGDEATVAACVEAFRQAYAPRSSLRTRPYEGVPELLDALAGLGLRMAVLSNKPHEATTVLVARLLDRWNFDPVFGERQGVPRKPDPAAALEAAALLGLEPGDVLYVGDTPTDVATALAAGMPLVAAAWGFRDEDELRAAGATRVARVPADVLDALR